MMFTILILIVLLISVYTLADPTVASTFDKIKDSVTAFGKDHGLIDKTPLEKAADLPREAAEKAKALHTKVILH